MDELKKFEERLSGRSSLIRNSRKKYDRGFIIRPEQMMDLLHDTHPELPIPKDAKHEGIGIEDAGYDSAIQFFFSSLTAPHEHCLAMKPHVFFTLLKDLSHGLIPLDGELDGIEISPRFTVILLRVKSSHWPPPVTDLLPLYHLRYEFGKLLLVPPESAIENQRRIRIN